MTVLKDSLASYGVDFEATMERFVDDINLYKECFVLFLEDENWEILDSSIASKQFQEAFDAAHTLKGIAGNLGIETLYKAICSVVESLRAQSYLYIERQMVEMKRILAELKALNITTECTC